MYQIRKETFLISNKSSPLYLVVENYSIKTHYLKNSKLINFTFRQKVFYLLIDYFFKKVKKKKRRETNSVKNTKKLRSARVKMVLLEYLAAEEFSR